MFSMNHLSAVILHLFLVLLHVEADTTGSENHLSEYTNLQPSFVVVIGLMSVMSVMSVLLLTYVKLCNRSGGVSADTNPPQNNAGLISRGNRFAGLDKAVIDSLPFFKFSSLKGSKEGLECAVCLSKFEDVEVLRLLPKCKHAFHMNCIDHWLEEHATCPLCRHRVSSEDLKLIAHSNSMRFLWNKQSEPRDELNNIELFVEREESRRGSSRFSIGSSFRKILEKGNRKEEQLLMTRKETESDDRVFHKHNHKITVSGFLFNNRWSNLSSSDLISLNSEMLNDMSSSRFSSTDRNNGMSSAREATEDEETMKTKEEKEFRKSLQSKAGITSSSVSRSVMNSGEHRSASEIVTLSRHGRFTESCFVYENNVKEERTREVWLPIARRTVQWFANREKSSQRESLDV